MSYWVRRTRGSQRGGLPFVPSQPTQKGRWELWFEFISRSPSGSALAINSTTSFPHGLDHFESIYNFKSRCRERSPDVQQLERTAPDRPLWTWHHNELSK